MSILVFSEAHNLVVILAAFLCFSLCIRTLYALVFTPSLKPTSRSTPNLPQVSVLLPVRNEASRILSQNLASLVRQEGLEIEVIAVNDQSTDRTGEILSEACSKYGLRLKVVQGMDRPNGWIGKTWAMQQAKKTATGQLLLCADADVVYDPSVVSRAVALLERECLDAVSILPHIETVGFWEAIVIPAMSWLGIMRVSPTQANRLSSKACLGHGNFILFRRAAHDAVGGFRAYSDDVLDDCAVMEILKQHGFRILVVYGDQLVRSRMYKSLGEMFQGFGKNAFASLNYSITRCLLSILSIFLSILWSPLHVLIIIILRQDLASLGAVLSITSLLVFWLTMIAFIYRIKGDYRFIFGYYLGFILSSAILVYSMVICISGFEVTWKERVLSRHSSNFAALNYIKRLGLRSKISGRKPRGFKNWLMR